MSNMVIFLDFDGVLHPVPYAEAEVFCFLDEFLSMLDYFPGVRIVISSSWRFQLNIDELQSMFGRHGDRLVGVTPDAHLSNFPRLGEILEWIRTNGYQGKWLAIDDAFDEFPDLHPNLFLCDRKVGLDNQSIIQLRSRIAEILND